jgi:HEPN domain-containing protein
MNKTKEWLYFAYSDILTCERILYDEMLSNIVAFHAQQAIEKSFKA